MIIITHSFQSHQRITLYVSAASEITMRSRTHLTNSYILLNGDICGTISRLQGDGGTDHHGCHGFPCHMLWHHNPADVEDISVSFVSSRLNVSEDEVAFQRSFEGQTARHAYLKQRIVRLPAS